MKQLLTKFMLVLILVSLSVMGVYSISEGADWKYFGSERLFHFYYDNESVKYEGNIVKVWTKQVIKDDTALLDFLRGMTERGESTRGYENFSYILGLDEINLYTKEYRFLKITVYDKYGRVLWTKTYDYSKWEAIPPESMVNTLYNILKATTTE